jgi:hypothetical protein
VAQYDSTALAQGEVRPFSSGDGRAEPEEMKVSLDASVCSATNYTVEDDDRVDAFNSDPLRMTVGSSATNDDGVDAFNSDPLAFTNDSWQFRHE